MTDLERRAARLLAGALPSPDPVVVGNADALRQALTVHGPARDDPRQCRACARPPVRMTWPCGYVRSLVDALAVAIRATSN